MFRLSFLPELDVRSRAAFRARSNARARNTHARRLRCGIAAALRRAYRPSALTWSRKAETGSEQLAPHVEFGCRVGTRTAAIIRDRSSELTLSVISSTILRRYSPGIRGAVHRSASTRKLTASDRPRAVQTDVRRPLRGRAGRPFASLGGGCDGRIRSSAFRRRMGAEKPLAARASCEAVPASLGAGPAASTPP